MTGTTVQTEPRGRGDGEAGAPLLDRGTELAHDLDKPAGHNPFSLHLLLKVWPSCGEATIQLRRISESLPKPRAREDEDQADAENVERSNRRRRASVRRYCKHNGLTHMPTLTYRHPRATIDEIAEDMRRFRYRLLRQRWWPPELRTFPYLWVPERGSHGTKRLHVHLAIDWWAELECVEVCSRCATPKLRAMRRDTLPPAGSRCIGCIWGHGFVGAPTDGTGDPRALASYVSKYVGKDLGELVEAGRQPYRVAEGFQPEPVDLEVRGHDQALELVAQLLEQDPAELEVTALHEVIEGWRAPATWTVLAP